MSTKENRQVAHEEIDYIFQDLLSGRGLPPRPEQIALSHRMLDAMFDGRIALCDAGTGIGKTLAYGDFFRNAPQLNPNRKLITGVICGVRVETIEEPLMQEIRYLDKLIDELAKGKAMEKILRGQVQGCEAAASSNEKTYLFDAVIEPVPDKGGAYVRFPYDIRKEFGKGRVKAKITFDGEPYSGSIVNMGVKNEDGPVCYIIGIRKDIREKIGKQPGDTVKVTVSAAQL